MGTLIRRRRYEMAIKGIKMLPPCVKNEDALEIYEILARVNAKLGSIKSEFNHSVIGHQLVQTLSLSESVQSTRIEGTQVTFTDAVEEKNNSNPSWEFIEIYNYQEALEEGTRLIKQGYPISTRMIKKLHKVLMANARGTADAGGEFRKIQNFIGPNNRIEDAVYIPVISSKIDEYMENLEHFINSEKHSSFQKHKKEDMYVFDESSPTLVKTAIMHAQFESIHPFLDGNGRLGRILIVLNLIQDEIIDVPIFFVSEELEKERSRYYDLLNSVRGESGEWKDWIKFFLTACDRLADSLCEKLKKIQDLAFKGLERCELDSEKDVWLYTFSDPFTTVSAVSKKLKYSQTTIRKALRNLSEKELLYSDKQSKRNIKYRNYDLMRILVG